MRKIIFGIVIVAILGKLPSTISQIIRSHTKYNKNKSRINEIDVRILTLKDQINEYTEKLEDVKSEYYVERIGRDKLRMVKEGEKIYKLAK